MSLVSADDFNLEPFNIPNISEFGNTFPDFVEEEETEVLNQILGRPLASKFIAGLEEDDPDQRWKDLRDGKEYTYNSIKYYFDGLKKAMKAYIFYKWTELSVESNTGLGFVSPNAENSQVVSPEFALSRGKNKFVKIVGNCNEQENTLFGFLYNSGDTYLADLADYDFTSIKTYVDTYFKSPRKRNSFGL